MLPIRLYRLLMDMIQDALTDHIFEKACQARIDQGIMDEMSDEEHDKIFQEAELLTQELEEYFKVFLKNRMTRILKRKART